MTIMTSLSKLTRGCWVLHLGNDGVARIHVVHIAIVAVSRIYGVARIDVVNGVVVIDGCAVVVHNIVDDIVVGDSCSHRTSSSQETTARDSDPFKLNEHPGQRKP